MNEALEALEIMYRHRTKGYQANDPSAHELYETIKQALKQAKSIEGELTVAYMCGVESERKRKV